MFNEQRAFELLKRISFERVAGSAKELECAKIIMDEIKNLGIKAHLEEFEIDNSVFENVIFETVEESPKRFKANAFKMCGSTKDEGIIAPFLYLENLADEYLGDISGKIVLTNTRIWAKSYKKFLARNVAGVIQISGSIYDEEEKSDLPIWDLREEQYALGKIPCVVISAKDAQELIKLNPKKVKIAIKQKEEKVISQNVVCEIKGIEKPEQIIAITAHYDSVNFSSGAYDNGSGVVGIMEILQYFIKNPPMRTLRFIWCGAEEIGLKGSLSYVKKHQDELNDYVYCLNIDMIGAILGNEVAISTAQKNLSDYISFLGCEIGVPVKSSQGVHSSDSTSFADAGIPSTTFVRRAPYCGARIHSREDVIENLSANAFRSSLTLIIEYAKRIVNAKYFPINKNIPQNMKDELDYYFARKERPAKE